MCAYLSAQEVAGLPSPLANGPRQPSLDGRPVLIQVIACSSAPDSALREVPPQTLKAVFDSATVCNTGLRPTLIPHHHYLCKTLAVCLKYDTEGISSSRTLDSSTGAAQGKT